LADCVEKLDRVSLDLREPEAGVRTMMGSQDGEQEQLFYSFSLEDHVPKDHLLRGIDRFLDLSELRGQLAPFYSHTGRPSIDPVLMIRMLVIGYSFGIRSERRLCDEVHLNLAYRWFCRLGLNEPVPDHSTFSKNRHGRFRRATCSVASSKWFSSAACWKGWWGRRLCNRRECHQGRCESGAVCGSGGGKEAGRGQRRLAGGARVSRRTGREQPCRAQQRLRRAAQWGFHPAEEHLPHGSRRPLDGGPRGPAFYAYSTNYLIDLDAGIIVDVEATPAHRTEEVDATRTTIERVGRQFDLTPKRLVADTAYGAAPMLNWIVNEKKIEPHIPVWEKSLREDGTFSRPDFRFDARTNTYECPGGKKLTSTGHPTNAGTVLFRALQHDCGSCALKQQCCPTPRIARSPGASTRRPVTSHVLYALRRPTSSHAGNGRRWRCCLPTSNAF
jgi:hypothetical protein